MYDSDQGTAVAALQGSSTAVFTDDTISKILALTTTSTNTTVNFTTATPDASGNVTVAAGSEVVFIATSDTSVTTIKAPVNAPVLIFEGKGGVNVTVNDGTTTVPAHAAGVVDRVIVGSSGNDHIVLSDHKNTQVTLGTGSSTVVAGAGEDTIVAGLGNSTISGGTGHAIVQLKGSASDYTVTVVNGHAVVTHNVPAATGGAPAGDIQHGPAVGDATAAATPITTDITKIQYVQLDGGQALILAANSTQAAVAELYQTALGHTADASGLQYWFNQAAAGQSLTQIADAITHSTEFTSAPQALGDAEFVNNLYQHTFARAGESAGLLYWEGLLNSGVTRAQVIQAFAEIGAQNLAHTAVHQEATIVGSITIVQGIV